MTEDRLMDRLRESDPATVELLDRASRGADELRRGIVLDGGDELAPRRRRRIAAAIAHGRVTAAAMALLVFVAAGVLVWRAFAPIDRIHPPVSAAPPADPLASIPPGWTEVPLPPEVRPGSSSLWTGSELLDWGGATYDTTTDRTTWLAGGFALDPASRTWRSIPDAPAPREDALAMWTGDEALFLWGSDRSGNLTDGLAYEPGAGTWRSIPAAPVAPRSGAVAVWTGSEAVVWGGGDPGSGTERTGAAYDPVADDWRPIADAPIGLNLATAVWTGREVVVFGSLLDSGNHAETPTAVGAAYDPSSDRWRKLPPSDLSPQATAAAWSGGRLIAWDDAGRSQTFDLADERWSPRASMPLDPGDCYPTDVALSAVILG